MIERFAAEFRRFDEDAQIFHHFLLSAEVFELQGSQGVFKFAVRGRRCPLLGAYVESIFYHKWVQN